MTTTERVMGDTTSPQGAFAWGTQAKTIDQAKPRSGKKKAGKSARKGLAGRAMADQAIWRQFQRVGGSLNPIQLSSILREADTGRIRRLIDLGNDARQKDCHLSAILSQSEETISGLEWKLTLPENARRREKKVLDFIDAHLRFGISQAFSDLLSHLAGAVYYSFAVSETEWVKDSGKLVPQTFHNQDARRFEFRMIDGKLVWRDEDMPFPGVDFLVDHPSKFICAQPRITGDVPTREGLIRVLMWAAMFRSWSFTDWLRTAEMAWKPWRTGVYKKNATKEDIDGLYEALERLASTGAGAFPETTDFKIQWPGGQSSSKPTHAELVNVIAGEMSKCVLGQTETTESSDSSGYAQAKVHYAVRANILRARARVIAAVITKYLIEPLVRLNFGDSYEIPRFEFITNEPTDLKAFSEGLRNLCGPQGAGLAVPAKWAREAAGIPDPDTDDELVGVAAEDEEDVVEDPEKVPTAEPSDDSVDDEPKDDTAGAPDDDA